MRPRLFLVGGPGGSGASTWAARVADDLAGREGSSVAVVATDPVFGAGRLVTEPGCVPASAPAEIPDPLAAAARSWRVDPFVVDQLLGRLDGLPVLWQLPDLLDRFDRVVVDAGSLLPKVLLTAHLLPWALDEVGPLHGGWLRATRPVTALAMGTGAIGRAGAEQLGRIVDRAAQLSELVLAPQTAVLLTGDSAPSKQLHAAAGVSLAQARLGATLGERDHPGLAQVPAWTELEPGWPDRLASPGRDVEIHGTAKDGDLVWRIPLPFNSFQDVELEQSGTALVVGVHDHRRTFVLPSLFARHVARSARLRHGILEVTFEPENA